MFLVTLTFTSAMGGMLYGFDTCVISGAKMYLYKDFPDITSFQMELVVSLTTVGGAIGSLTAGVISDKFGRKPTVSTDLVIITGALVMAYAPSIQVVMIGRLILGYGVGNTSMIVPVYLAEMAPKHV